MKTLKQRMTEETATVNVVLARLAAEPTDVESWDIIVRQLREAARHAAATAKTLGPRGRD